MTEGRFFQSNYGRWVVGGLIVDGSPGMHLASILSSYIEAGGTGLVGCP